MAPAFCFTVFAKSFVINHLKNPNFTHLVGSTSTTTRTSVFIYLIWSSIRIRYYHAALYVQSHILILNMIFVINNYTSLYENENCRKIIQVFTYRL